MTIAGSRSGSPRTGRSTGGATQPREPASWRRSPWTSRGVALYVAVMMAGACSPAEGHVEAYWQFVDQRGTTVFPPALFDRAPLSSTCAFPATRAGVDTTARLWLGLRICREDCDCMDDACLVGDVEHVLACDDAREFLWDVPATPEGGTWVMQFVPHLLPEGDAAECAVSPSCVTLPGPRRRRVEPGLVTDLAVTQAWLDVAWDAANTRALDLDTCCEPATTP